MRKNFSIFVITLLILVSITSKSAFAANTTIEFSPKNGSFNKPFTVDLVIDGHGDKFNAAEATVLSSSNLAIKDLSLGDCNFSFLQTPSIQNPSFAGVIISTYTTKCTAYTLTLVPTTKGKASLELAKASVKRYGDAANILSSISNASYDLTSALQRPSLLDTQTQQNNEYTLLLTVLASENSPASHVTVTLNSVSIKNKIQKTTDQSGKIQFTGLQKGVYDAVITENNNKVGENIVNINGTNKILSLSINLAAQKNNPLLKGPQSFINTLKNSPFFLIGALVLGIILGVGITVLILKLISRRQ